jgi:hypothetical protein
LTRLETGNPVKAIRSFSVSALAAAALLGMAGCSAMSGGQESVGGAEAGGFIGYQVVKSK